VAAVFWPQTAIETAGGSTATELQYYYGDVRRYGAKLDSSTDDTAAFNAAIQSGYMAFCDVGIANIQGTIVLDGNDASPSTNGGKHLRLSGQVVLQRFDGAAVTPILHVYGNNNYVEGNKATIRQNLYEHADGIVLLGQDPNEAAVPGTTNINTTNNNISGLKIVGPENTAAELETGSPGLYIHSAQRKMGSFVGVVTYKNALWDMQVLNCDVLVEFSSDANANSMHHLHLHQWIKHGIMFNAAYGNCLYGVKMESPLENIVPSATQRYAIQFGAQNDGVESDTSTTYSIDSAYFNRVHGWAELPNSGNKVIRLMGINETGTAYGRNDVVMMGTLAGGIGAGGSSADASLGFNSVDAGGVTKDLRNIIQHHGWMIRTLDDGSGSYRTKNAFIEVCGRSASVPEATQEDVFSIAGIGPNSSCAYIKLSYAAKMDAISSAQVGEVIFAVWQETTSSYFTRKLSEVSTSFDEAAIVTPNIAVAVGDLSTEMKATVGFLTASPAGTNSAFIAWKAEIITTELAFSTSDYDADLKIL
jgi:hypothetical protein